VELGAAKARPHRTRGPRRRACVIVQAICVDGSTGSLARNGRLDRSFSHGCCGRGTASCAEGRGVVLGALLLELARVCN